RKFLHALYALRTIVEVAPHGAAGPDPCGVDIFRKEFWIGRWAKVWQDRAVHERVQILADNHYTPRRRYRPRDGRGLAKTFRLFSAVTQLEWPIQGLTMAQTNHPAAEIGRASCRERV